MYQYIEFSFKQKFKLIISGIVKVKLLIFDTFLLLRFLQKANVLG